MFKRNGFTLIELLLVVALIGLISTLAFYSLTVARMRSRDTRRVNDISQLRNALDLYFGSKTTYPVTPGPIVLGSEATSAFSDAGFTAPGSQIGTIYMAKVPANVQPGGIDYSYYSALSDGSPCTVGPCADYNIGFSLEGAINRLASGPHAANASGIK